MMFYTPWCGHCKVLLPIWNQLASDLKDVPNLMIGKLDFTENEVHNLEIQAYPTIKLYPKGKKSDPISYDGGRELEDFK